MQTMLSITTILIIILAIGSVVFKSNPKFTSTQPVDVSEKDVESSIQPDTDIPKGIETKAKTVPTKKVAKTAIKKKGIKATTQSA